MGMGIYQKGRDFKKLDGIGYVGLQKGLQKIQ